MKSVLLPIQMRLLLICLTGILQSFVLCASHDAAHNECTQLKYTLTNSVWVVPPENLLAYAFTPNLTLPITDPPIFRWVDYRQK